MWRNITTYIFFDIKRYSSDQSIQAIFGQLHAKSPGRLHSKYSHVIVIVLLRVVQFGSLFIVKYSR